MNSKDCDCSELIMSEWAGEGCPDTAQTGIVTKSPPSNDEDTILKVLNGKDVRTAKRILENILSRLDINSFVKSDS